MTRYYHDATRTSSESINFWLIRSHVTEASITFFATCVHQGDTPTPPPVTVPSPRSSSTDLNSQDAEVNHVEIDRRNSESEEDDVSLPPGVILVTTPMEELPHDEKESNGRSSSIQGISKTRVAHLLSTIKHKTFSWSILSKSFIGYRCGI